MNRLNVEMRKCFSLWTFPVGWHYSTTAVYFLNHINLRVKNTGRTEIIRKI